LSNCPTSYEVLLVCESGRYGLPLTAGFGRDTARWAQSELADEQAFSLRDGFGPGAFLRHRLG